LDGIYSQVECAAGELEVANAQAERAATQLAELGTIGHFSANDILRTFATIAYENDRLDEVEILLDRCVEIVRIGRPIFLLLARLELARLANARGDAAGALAEADRAGSALGPSIRSPLSERVDAYRARLLAEHGDPQGARAITTKLTPGRARSVAEIRCHLAEKDAAGARAVLESMPPASTPRTALETALLEARIAIESTDDDTEIAVAIDRALALGRAGGFARTLADEGPELSAALARVLRRQPADPYSDTLAPILERAIAARPAQNVPLFGGVVLSERELTVLKYLATRLATREIATELFVSMNTLRTHSKNIYRKLGVDSRAGAVEAAHTLGIL
jgi:LuxR family maltose regulon positive regulatory protein